MFIQSTWYSCMWAIWENTEPSTATIVGRIGLKAKREFRMEGLYLQQKHLFFQSPHLVIFHPIMQGIYFQKYTPRKTSWAWHICVQTAMTWMTTSQISCKSKMRQSKDIYICWEEMPPHLHEHVQLIFILFIHSVFPFTYLVCQLVIQSVLMEVVLQIYHTHDNRYSLGYVCFWKACGTWAYV